MDEEMERARDELVAAALGWKNKIGDGAMFGWEWRLCMSAEKYIRLQKERDF
jgi:hypothetical protein